MSMMVKFETRSHRVKGISFHNKRPWVLVGLHNGTVQIWDYRTGSMVDRFDDHEGPVRGVDFHSQQPIFATGGDDYKIKIWNYKLSRCLYTLLGHLDYIRTVQFHKEQPWLVSACDDQTLRIWNWQSRCCVSVLTGHNHYVMSAQFHPKWDYIVSASLDLTIRVWDISGLRAKKQDTSIALPQDFFGSNDVVVKFLLEGHEKGVNWASFHPTKPNIVSASDDRSIRIWRMDDTRAAEVEQLRGHTNNLTCVSYFKDRIVSSAEDRSIRVWDTNLRTPIQSFRFDNDRFWVLATHPEQNLIAAGHDSGLMVFKLERERPAHCVANGGKSLLYIKERTLRSYDFATRQTTTLINYRRNLPTPTTLSCNAADNTAVMWSEQDGGIFELFNVPASGPQHETESKKGYYTSAVFFAANKFAVLDRTGQLIVRTASNDIAKVIPAIGDTNRIFPGPQGSILLRSPEKVSLFDMAQRRVVAEIAIANVRYVAWDPTFNRVALLTKHVIVVASRRLTEIVSVRETTRIKSACFDEERSVLYFTTQNHLKYLTLMQTKELGTIKTLDRPVYLIRSKSDVLWYINRDGAVVEDKVDNTELNFKLALQQERFRDVLKIIQHRKMHGQALASHLHKTGHPDIAMHFVADPLIKFNLAVECGMMDVAKETAKEVNTRDTWQELAKAAMKCGDIQLAQLANVKAQNFQALGVQCAITGNMPALQQVSQKSNDENFKMQYSLVTGDAMVRIHSLAAAGQLPLAYCCAVSNGLTEVAEEILEKMAPEVAARAQAVAVKPTAPRPEVAVEDSNWPMLPVKESLFTRLIKQPGTFDMEEEAGEKAEAGNWPEEDDLDFGDGEPKGDDDEAEEGAAATGEAGEWPDSDDDLDLDAYMVNTTAKATSSAATGAGGYVVPREGESCQKHWTDSSSTAVHAIAAGAFQAAVALLQRQICLSNAEPLQKHFLQIWTSCNAVMPSSSLLPPHVFAVTTAPDSNDDRAKHSPMMPFQLPALKERLRLAYAAVTEGKFTDALRMFQAIMHSVLFVVVASATELNEARELLAVAREYAGALNVEVARKDVQDDPKRAVELAIYFTTYKMQNTHLVLTLGQAMSQAFKLKCMKTAGIMARRQLDLDPPAKHAEKARKVAQVADQNPADAVKLDYDDRNPFVMCAVSKTPMYRGAVDPIRCCFCQSSAKPEFRGQTCPVCLISALGGEASGMVLRQK
jgi:coatomer protein complex subunit alpha (xenin)